MAVDVFLKIEGVKGESKDTKHPNEIDVLSWSWGITQTGTMAYGGGGGGGKANVSDISLMKRMDAATSRLMDSVQNGKHFDSAILTVRKAGGKQEEYFKISFWDLLVTSLQHSASSEEPMESLSLNFAKYKTEYAPQKEDGSLLPYIEFEYDLKKMK
jgi:type VI secretion system secreted protein Hcp